MERGNNTTQRNGCPLIDSVRLQIFATPLPFRSMKTVPIKSVKTLEFFSCTFLSELNDAIAANEEVFRTHLLRPW